ncbi:MAG: hypothetical protein Ct9H300mP4_09190 [Gammaproteobacteria bacterium]|nr:MAG: hypothetical protein Ct9H300mP4_09190 [Gammaproteobacteria bacterium]
MTFSPKNQSHFLVVYLLLFIFQNSFAESLEFPDGDWTQKNPSEVNVSENKVKDFLIFLSLILPLKRWCLLRTDI